MKALVFGEILWDIIDGKPHLGGAPLNFAAHIKQCGGDASIISCLGKDELGDKALKITAEWGVDVNMIQRADTQTGYVPVTLVAGQPDYVIVEDVAYDYIETSALDHDEIDKCDTFYFGSVIQRSSKSRAALQVILMSHSFKHIFYDVNLRKNSYTQQVIEFSLTHCTMLKVNDDEVEVLSEMLFGESQPVEEFCERIYSKHPQIAVIIITAGAEGCYVFENGKLKLIPTEPIKVKDTVGAGDAFSAAFASVHSKTGDAFRAATVANKVGGFIASTAGPVSTYPDYLRELVTGDELQ